MRKRLATKEAHGQAAAAIRQYADQQGGLLGVNEDEDEAIRAALLELADRHDRAARVTRPNPVMGQCSMEEDEPATAPGPSAVDRG